MGLNKKVLAFGATGILALGITGAAVGGHLSNSTANKAYASGGTATLAQMSLPAQGTATTGQTTAQAAVAKAAAKTGTKAMEAAGAATTSTGAAQSAGLSDLERATNRVSTV